MQHPIADIQVVDAQPTQRHHRWYMRTIACVSVVALQMATIAPSMAALTKLGDEPPEATTGLQANVMFTLSAEWPTGAVQAYNDETTPTCQGRNSGHSVCYKDRNRVYLGIFDPYKCYSYNSGYTVTDSLSTTNGAFIPRDIATINTANGRFSCEGKAGRFSGDYLNWATSHSLDIFRFVLSGGDRVRDELRTTVLEKSRHTGQGGFNQFPIKRVGGGDPWTGFTPVSSQSVTPYNLSGNSVFLRVNSLGVAIRISNNAAAAENNGVTNCDASGVPVDPNATWVCEFQARVKVCDVDNKPAAVDISDWLEENCTQYGTDSQNFKPTGLIQQNEEKMRFGMFAYLNDSSALRDGGVMRSRMKSVGPQFRRADGTLTTNAASEINANGFLVQNPDSADATATNTTLGIGSTDADFVKRSGVLQYLNKFGKTNTRDLKGFDPLSEMFYEAQRYMRKLPHTPRFSDGFTKQTADGFPVITSNWYKRPDGTGSLTINDDPIQAWCQKNFFIGIADSNTHKDKNLPGGVGVGTYSNEPTTASEGPGSTYEPKTAVNVSSLSVAIATFQGLAASWGQGSNHCCDGSGYVAGLAYWANAYDIRDDMQNNQHIKTYFIDVRESGSWGPYPNQLWMAAKFGGFDADPSGTGPEGTMPTVKALWDKDNDNTPDTYYPANQPERIRDGLQKAFADILSTVASGAAIGVSGESTVDSPIALYVARFDSSDWSGDLIARRLTGNLLTTSVWNAADLLDQATKPTNGWDVNRKIATSVPAGLLSLLGSTTFTGTLAGAGKPFRFNQLNNAQKAALNSNTSLQEPVLKWLRGDYSNEVSFTTSTTPFRSRFSVAGDVAQTRRVLGDIVRSQPVVMAPQLYENYTDDYNPGYLAYRTSRQSKGITVIVGSNGGMIHAFNGAITGSDAGKERWAYVPSFFYGGQLSASAPTTAANPADSGLQALTNISYSHRNYADGVGVIKDVDFARTNGASGSGQWRSVYVAGLGKGGRGYVAIDVTNADSHADETAVANSVLWEFTDEDMGFTYSRPTIVRTAKWGWVVIVTSGYNNVFGTNKGQGFLYVLDIKTGALLQKIGTGEGSATDPSGLSPTEAYIPNTGKGETDYVYAGDLFGNLWRFNFSSASANVPAPKKMASLGAPMTSEVGVIADRWNDGARWVFFGTGRSLHPDDRNESQAQRFYAMTDGYQDRALLDADVTTATQTSFKSITVAQLKAGFTYDVSKRGWSMGFPNANASGGTERMDTNPDIDFITGKIAWAGNMPSAATGSSGADPCQPSGKSFVYGFDLRKRQSFVTTATGFLERPSLTTSIQGLVARASETGAGAGGLVVKKITCDSTGNCTEIPQATGTLKGIARVNWREITE